MVDIFSAAERANCGEMGLGCPIIRDLSVLCGKIKPRIALDRLLKVLKIPPGMVTKNYPKNNSLRPGALRSRGRFVIQYERPES